MVASHPEGRLAQPIGEEVPVPCDKHQRWPDTCPRTRGAHDDGCPRLCGQPSNGPMCPDCEAELRTALVGMSAAWAELAVALVPGTAGPRAIVSASRDLPSPVDQGTRALMDDLAWWLILAADEVRVLARLAAGPERVRTGHAVQAACRTLAAHIATLLAVPETPVWDPTAEAWVDVDGPGLADRLLALHWRVGATLGVTCAAYREHAPCIGCGLAAIVRYDGHDDRLCRACGRAYSADDYAQLVAGMAAWVESGT